jgi:RNA polymerase sigma-70 factor (ECF subfamily)
MDAGFEYSAIFLHSRAAPHSNDIGNELISEIKHLRAFAICLSGSISAADELVEATLLRAWSKSDQFHIGINRGLVFLTILRTIFYSRFRKRGSDAQNDDDLSADPLADSADEEGRVDQRDIRRALSKLPNPQREVMILVGAGGYTFEEAAAICQLEIGTVKKRMNQARLHLIKLLDL